MTALVWSGCYRARPSSRCPPTRPRSAIRPPATSPSIARTIVRHWGRWAIRLMTWINPPSRRRQQQCRLVKHRWYSTMEIPMSTDFVSLKKIAARDLFDGRLEEFGVLEHVKPDETTETKRCLTDGRNYLWVYINNEGFVACFSRYGGNAPGKILSAITDAFDTDIVSEYQPQ